MTYKILSIALRTLNYGKYMVSSLSGVMQDLCHQPRGSLKGVR